MALSQSAKMENLDGIDILIVGNRYKNDMYNILQSTKNQSLLIVGYTRGLEKKGAGINFFVSESKVRFKISKKAINSNKLKVSSQLMRLAILVE